MNIFKNKLIKDRRYGYVSHVILYRYNIITVGTLRHLEMIVKFNHKKFVLNKNKISRPFLSIHLIFNNFFYILLLALQTYPQKLA